MNDTVLITGRSSWKRWAAIILFIIVLVGLGNRLFMSVNVFAGTFDTATPGLMGLHILKGERPLFYYGQSYMGALEAYLAAGLFAVFGPSLTTLSLSPILFSMGWLVTTYLLFRDLFDKRVGLMAAFCVALPGWQTLWYNLGSYGGYPGFFFFGTLTLWLSVKILKGSYAEKGQWIALAVMGLSAGLGIWTNYQVLAYLAPATVLVALEFIRCSDKRTRMLQYALAGVLAVAAVIPVLAVKACMEGGQIIRMNPSLGFVKQSINRMWGLNLPEYFTWPLELPGWVVPAVVILFVAACALYVIAFVVERDRGKRWAYLFVVLFSGLFLAMYLPHSMSHLRAPRYIIPLTMMVICSVFAVPQCSSNRIVRWIGSGLLILWLGYHAYGSIHTAIVRAPRKNLYVERRSGLVDHAEQVGARTVHMVGGRIFGHEGQVIDFYAKDRIRFVSVFNERYQPAAQAAETDPEYALAYESSKVKKFKKALQGLQVEFKDLPDPWVSLFHKIRVPTRYRSLVPASEMAITPNGELKGEPGNINDRIFETSIEGSLKERTGFIIDLGKERTIDSLWLTSTSWLQFGLPTGFKIHTSLDGENWTKGNNVLQRIPVAYTQDQHVYMKGYFGLMEICGNWPARYLRMIMTGGQGKNNYWEVSEVFVFERVTGFQDQDDPAIEALVRAIQDEDLTFTIANRWLSAKLFDVLPDDLDKPRVYPRFNPKNCRSKLSRRVHPGPGTGLAVHRAIKDECVRLLKEVHGDDVVKKVIDFSRYSLVVLDNPGQKAATTLVWNGHTLLKTAAPAGEIF